MNALNKRHLTRAEFFGFFRFVFFLAVSVSAFPLIAANALGSNGSVVAEVPSELTVRLDEIQARTTPDLRLDVFAVQTNADEKSVLVETTSSEAKRAVLALSSDFPDWKFDAKLLPEENVELGGRYFGLTNFSTIQLQKKPDHAAEWGTQSLMGTPVRILKRAPGGWILIQNADGYLGYTTAGSVCAMTREDLNRWLDSKRLVWVELFGFIYSEPNEKSPTISDLTACNVVVWKNEETSGDFFRVETPDGRLGWIPKRGAVEWNEWLATRQFDAAHLIETAKLLLGAPYVWGGGSAKGVDCSGLTSLVFLINRTNILRDVSQLQREGVEVDLSNGWKSLQAGDLLIFGAKRSDGSRRFRHVALYLGEGRFIHSATSVHMSSLDPGAPDYDEGNARELFKAVRYVGAPNGEYFKPISENPFYQKR